MSTCISSKEHNASIILQTKQQMHLAYISLPAMLPTSLLIGKYYGNIMNKIFRPFSSHKIIILRHRKVMRSFMATSFAYCIDWTYGVLILQEVKTIRPTSDNYKIKCFLYWSYIKMLLLKLDNIHTRRYFKFVLK
jgi:hypothetical protein